MKKFVILSLFVFAVNIFAQNDAFDFYARGSYRPEVPRPSSILRYDVGTHHTTYSQMETVIEKIQKSASDRVKIYDIGETNEHRMMHVVAISSPENIARLDEIRDNTAKLSDPRTLSATDAQTLIAKTPIISWLAYTIHGNESSSFETFMQVIYQLAASNEPETLDILKNSVVLIVTGENPDGHERFATWYNSVAVGDPDHSSLEHREPWSIYGRLSHFRFDLNRDNIVSTQRETQNLQWAYFQWNPQISVDLHGQVSQYFFPPAALPINPNLPQPVTNKWLDVFGRSNAAQFDARKWDYYVRDVFDLFYPGYWDSFPALNGATAMTYETDGGGFQGLNWTRDDGTIATFRGSIAKHYVASLATIETAAKNREARLRDYFEFRINAMGEAKTEKMKTIVVSPEKDRVKTAELIEALRRANIEVKVATSVFTSTSAHSYEQKVTPAIKQTFSAGSYIISLNQPQKRLIKALLEQDTPQDKAFVDDNLAKFKRNEMRGKSAYREDYGFYDITAWSIPLAFGVDAFWTEDVVTGNIIDVTDDYLSNQKRGSVNAKAQIAYIIPYETDTAGIMAIRLLKEGYKVAVALRTMNAAGKNWNKGTFVVRVTRNPDSVHDAVNRLAKELGVNVTAVNTSFSDEGDTGIGGENVVSLQSPRIAMVADEAVDQTSYGSIWWTLDRYGIAFTPLNLGAIKNGALSKYSVLIMPDGSAGRYFSTLDKGGISTLKDWVSNGGTVICVKGAAVFAALKDVGLTSAKLVGSDDDEQKGKAIEEEIKAPEVVPNAVPSKKKTIPEPTPTPELKFDKADGFAPTLPPIASPSANAGNVPEGTPGAIMRATVDRTTYLTYGLNQAELPVLLGGGYFFRYSKEGTNALVFDARPTKPLTISGYVWEGNTERLLKGTAYLIDEPSGGGHAILFAEEPFFRGIFRSATRPFFNSILFNGTL